MAKTHLKLAGNKSTNIIEDDYQNAPECFKDRFQSISDYKDFPPKLTIIERGKNLGLDVDFCRATTIGTCWIKLELLKEGT